MPTEKPNKEKTKEVPKKVSAFGPKDPSKFILHISKCGTDVKSSTYPQVENDNPVILGLNGIKIICDGFAPQDKQPFYQYLLACALLKGLDFNRENLFQDVDNIADRIKNLSLKTLKGGNTNERP